MLRTCRTQLQGLQQSTKQGGYEDVSGSRDLLSKGESYLFVIIR